jgi:hypothetical protein
LLPDNIREMPNNQTDLIFKLTPGGQARGFISNSISENTPEGRPKIAAFRPFSGAFCLRAENGWTTKKELVEIELPDVHFPHSIVVESSICLTQSSLGFVASHSR